MQCKIKWKCKTERKMQNCKEKPLVILHSSMLWMFNVTANTVHQICSEHTGLDEQISLFATYTVQIMHFPGIHTITSAAYRVIVWPTASCFADWSKRLYVTFSIIECWASAVRPSKMSRQTVRHTKMSRFGATALWHSTLLWGRACLLVICRNGCTNVVILFYYYRPH